MTLKARPPQPCVRQVGVSDLWDIVGAYETASGGTLFQFRDGFRYDRSSIPEVVPSWIISKDDLGCRAPAVHDGLSRCAGVPEDAEEQSGDPQRMVVYPWRRYTRDEADEVFRQMLREDGVVRWRARAAWIALRIGGARSWKT